MEVNPLFFDSYLSFVEKSVGSKMFQTLWAEVDGKKKDITQRGKLSCATFVSFVLLSFGLIKEKHATVNGTVRDMENSGWRKIRKPRRTLKSNQ